MNKFEHFILVRYNLGMYSDNVYNVQNPDEWMDNRLPLFERMLQSLKAQTAQRFTLIVGLDYNTPDDKADEVSKTIVKYFKYPQVQVRFMNPKDFIQQLQPQAEWLITSRMDNDDEYYPEFVESIQDAFRDSEEVIDVIGHQCFNGELYTSGRPTPNSPFISLVERWGDNVQTVYRRPHSVMNSEYLSRYASLEPLYIQHIHERNQANKLIGKKL